MIKTRAYNFTYPVPGITPLVVLIVTLLLQPMGFASAQNSKVIADLSNVDGVSITPHNVWRYRIINETGRAVQSHVTGTIRYKQNGLYLRYAFDKTLYPGDNTINEEEVIRASWESSDQALRELFFDYETLPQGVYEYCVSVSVQQSGDKGPDKATACVYNRSNDIFLIDLIAPNNRAELYEINPLFSWVATYPFASELTYRLRLFEIKSGQNPVAAVSRNNPIFSENNISSISLQYPLYARPLQVFQPYAWAVDAYYKGILLGGSEPWKFTIVEDSSLADVAMEQSYYDFEQHLGETRIYAVGALKIKYFVDRMSDTLEFALYHNDNRSENLLKSRDQRLALQSGDNRIDLDLDRKVSMRHGKKYVLIVRTSKSKTYEVPFQYINPAFIKK